MLDINPVDVITNVASTFTSLFEEVRNRVNYHVASEDGEFEGI